MTGPVVVVSPEELRGLVREAVEAALSTQPMAPPASPADPRPARLLTAQEVRDLIGISCEREWQRMRAAGALPPAIRISERRLRWRPRDVERWLDERREGRP